MVASTFKYDEEIDKILKKAKYFYNVVNKEEAFKKILIEWDKSPLSKE